MNDEQDRDFRRLCREMRAWPEELAARLKGAPPVGLHFFVWRELTQPTLCCGPGDPLPLEEPIWKDFQAKNEGCVEQAIGGAEKWGRFSYTCFGVPLDHTGCFRFFGQVSREELDRIVGIIMEVLKNADDTISKYLQLPVEPWRRWRFHRELRQPPDGRCPIGQERLLSLISLATGYDYDDIEILVQDEGDESFDHDFEPFDQEFLKEPWDGVRSAVDVYSCQDFVAAFTQAVNKWITEEIELGVPEEDEAEAESEDKASDLPKRPSPAADDAPIVKSITVKMQNGGLVLTSLGRRPVSVPPELEFLFAPFLANIANKNPGKIVGWSVLHQLIGENDADSGKASDDLRGKLFDMRKLLKELGQPPDRGLWIKPKKASKGCCLNTECNWWADKDVEEEYIEHLSRRTTDPKPLEQNSPDKAVVVVEDWDGTRVETVHKLPARSEQSKLRRHDDDKDQ